MRKRPDWWPRMDAVDWVLVALFAGTLCFELLVCWAVLRGWM